MAAKLTEARAKAKLLGAEPQLFVADIAAACEFYAKKLGFAVAFTYGEPPFYAQVTRDSSALNLRQLDAPAMAPALRDREELLAATITVDDVKALYVEFEAAGVRFQQVLRTEEWGAKTFVVGDLDGNLILFAG